MEILISKGRVITMFDGNEDLPNKGKTVITSDGNLHPIETRGQCLTIVRLARKQCILCIAIKTIS